MEGRRSCFRFRRQPRDYIFILFPFHTFIFLQVCSKFTYDLNGIAIVPDTVYRFVPVILALPLSIPHFELRLVPRLLRYGSHYLHGLTIHPWLYPLLMLSSTGINIVERYDGVLILPQRSNRYPQFVLPLAEVNYLPHRSSIKHRYHRKLLIQRTKREVYLSNRNLYCLRYYS